MKYIHSQIKFIVISCFVIVFTGCSGSAFKHFNKKDQFVQNTQYSQMLKIVEDDRVKAIASVTYLNSADSSQWDNGKQNFIIGVYIIDENKECCNLELKVLQEKKIQLDVTNIEYEEVVLVPQEEKLIEKSDPLYDTIPFRNNWAEYKLVSYNDRYFEDSSTITFIFGEKKVSFSKE